MGLILKAEGERELVPEGQYVGVCVDVVDLGMVESEWQGETKVQHKCRVVFELGESKADGSRHTISERFTASLHEKAALRKFLQSWRGKPFTAEELKGFDTESLIGVNAILQVVHNTKGDRTFDNIDTVMRPVKGTKWFEPSGKYIRVKDRTPAQAAAAPPDDTPPPDDNDGLPF